MPAPIILRNLTPPPKKAGEAPMIATRSDLRDGARGAGDGGGNTPGGPVGPDPFFEFESDFTDSPNMTLHNSSGGASRFASSGQQLPTGWDASRVGSTTSNGNFTQITCGEITDDPDKIIEPGQKSYVTWRHSAFNFYTWDSTLSKSVPNLRKVYVKFRFRFGPGWNEPDSAGKLFRVKRNPTTAATPNWSQTGGGILWSFSHYSSIRNKLTFRPNDFTDPPFTELPYPYSGSDFSFNYTYMTYDLNGDGIVDNDPQLPDRVNGGIIPNDRDFTATKDHVYGDAWHEMEFLVQMNTAPGAADGKLIQRLNGSVIFRNEKIGWMQPGDPNPDLFWNSVQIGGNHLFETYPESADVSQWFAWDRVFISSEPPEDLI